MDYGRFIRLISKVPFNASSEKRIWNNINHTLRGNRSSVLSLADFWPRFLISAAALAAIFLFYFYNFENQLEARNFIQNVYSTQYIYETCKYDGQWN